jgi:hypothetical protein
MRMNDPKVANVQPARHLVFGAVTLAAVGAPAAWLATAWALSQAAKTASAGQAAEGWILAMRPVLIPVAMTVAWLAARRTGPKGWARAVRLLGTGALVSVIVLFIDGVMATGF